MAGQVVARAEQSWRILETMHPPSYYLPVAAFQPGTLIQSTRTSFCEWKGVARYFSIALGDRIETDAAWGYGSPSPAYAALRDHVAVYAGRMDSCFVGDERVTPQPGGFYGGWITASFIGPFKGGPGTAFW